MNENELRRMALEIDPIAFVDSEGGPHRLSVIVGMLSWDAAQRTFPEIGRFLAKLAEVTP